MGRTSKPLYIVTVPKQSQWMEIMALREQGHTVLDATCERIEWDKVDIFLADFAHRMSEDERPWLDEAIKEARRRKYPKDPA